MENVLKCRTLRFLPSIDLIVATGGICVLQRHVVSVLATVTDLMLPKSVAVRQRKGQRHKSGEAELLTQRLMGSIDKVKVTLNAK